MTSTQQACARCGLLRASDDRRSNYCRDCAKASKAGGAGWMRHGACIDPQYHPEWWFPASQSDPMTPNAILICQDCKVRDLCLDYAMKCNEEHGIWGGLLAEERRRIRALQRKRAS